MIWAIYPIKSEKETTYISEEVANVFGNKKNFIKLMKYVQKLPHKFIYINNMSQSDPKLRIGWDIEIPTEEIENFDNNIEIEE
jgi:hypothetical protein